MPGDPARASVPSPIDDPPRSVAPAPELSVVLPFYDEQELASQTLAAVKLELDKTGASYELVCVDDGSSDETLAQLQRASLADARIRVTALTRNFGKEAAMAAGLDAARGRAVVVMDSDLQHPPELLPALVGQWRAGYEIVNAVKQSRGDESIAYRLLAALFNQLMGGVAGATFRGASDYKLLDRCAVDALRQLPERTRFFRGLVTWVGFRTTDVPFAVAPRAAGRSKWSTRALFRYSLRNLLAFSAFPLRLVATSGAFTLLFSGGLGVWTLYRYLRGDALTGFTTVILLQLILGGLLLSGIGVIALYLGAIYEELKARPAYIVRRDESR